MKQIIDLPDHITVSVIKAESGILIADLPELNSHVEADSVWELIRMVNNLIKLYFDIPEETPFMYAPNVQNKNRVSSKLTHLNFLKYYTPSLRTGC